MTSGGLGEMLSPWEQPLVKGCHSLQKYSYLLVQLSQIVMKLIISIKRHVPGVFLTYNKNVS